MTPVYVGTLCSLKINEVFLHTDVTPLHGILSGNKDGHFCEKEKSAYGFVY